MNRTTSLIALALIGTAVTLLFTTEKGGDYRKSIARGSKKLGKKIGRTAGATADDLMSLKNNLAEALGELGGDARQRALDIFDEGAKTGRRMKKRAWNQFA